MTNPTRKRVVTLDDLNVLNQNAAYARQKGEEASAAAQQADTARQNLEELGGDTRAAGEQATQAAQAANLAKNSATAAALQASQAAGDAVTAAELAEGAAGTANQAAGAAMTAAQRVTDAVLDLTDIIAATAQAQATLTQLANLTQAASVATIPATAGLYIITAGAEAGQVHERISGGGTVPRPELEGLGRMAEQAARAAHRRYRAGDYQIGPQYTAAQNAARINALAAQIGAAFTLEIPGGITQFDSTLNLPYYVHLVGSNGFIGTASSTSTPMLQYTGSGVAIIAAGSLQLTDVTICGVRPGTTEGGSIFRPGTTGVRTAGSIQFTNAYLYGFGTNLNLQQGGYYSQWIGGENSNADILVSANDPHNLTIFKVRHARYNKGYEFSNSVNPVTFIVSSFEYWTTRTVSDPGSSQINFIGCYVENYPTTAISAGLTSGSGFYQAPAFLVTGGVTVAGKFSSVRLTDNFISARGVDRIINASGGTLASLVSTGNKIYKNDGDATKFIYRVDTLQHGLFADARELDATNYVNASARTAAGVLLIEPGVDVFGTLAKLAGATFTGAIAAPNLLAPDNGVLDGNSPPSAYRLGVTYTTVSSGSNYPNSTPGNAVGMLLTISAHPGRVMQWYYANNAGYPAYIRSKTSGADTWDAWRPINYPTQRIEALGAVTARTVAVRVVDTPHLVQRVLGTLLSASTSGDVVVEFRVGGAWRARATFAAGSTTPAMTWASGSSMALAAGDVLSVHVTSAGMGAADLGLTLAAPA